MKICSIKINGSIREYKIKNNPLNKNINLSIKKTGEFIVTKPKYVSYKKAEDFVLSKSSWIEKNLKKFADQNLSILPDIESYKKLKNTAKRMVEEKIHIINAFYNFDYNKISIRNQTSRWGSCSKKKNLSFNYKLVYLEDDIVNYVIAHELCHLKELNHSERFWKLVQSYVPNYKELRKKLREINL